MATDKEQYIRKLNTIAARYGRMEDQTARRALAMLKGLRSEIAAELATVTTDWNAFRLRQLQTNIDRLIDKFQAQATQEFSAALASAMTDGAAAVTEPLGALGIEAAFLRPSMAQANVVLDFSADLIQGIAADMRQKINQRIRLAALGQQSPFDAMKAITQDLGIEASTGVWAKRPPVVKGVAARAETVLRTELQRVYNLATHSQQLAQAEMVPGLMKSWVATADNRTRRGHLRAHQDYKDPIPVNEPFIVYDISDKGQVKGHAELMYPGDPSAGPQYTINCRCRQVTVHPAVGRIGTSLDGRISQAIARRNGGG